MKFDPENDCLEEHLLAVGHNVALERPKKITETTAGIIIPMQAARSSFYGRVISIGRHVKAGGEIEPDDIVVCMKAGAGEIEMEEFVRTEAAREQGCICVAEAMIYCKLSEAYADYLGLRVNEIGSTPVPTA